jgi:hypothetical protein
MLSIRSDNSTSISLVQSENADSPMVMMEGNLRCCREMHRVNAQPLIISSLSPNSTESKFVHSQKENAPIATADLRFISLKDLHSLNAEFPILRIDLRFISLKDLHS